MKKITLTPSIQDIKDLKDFLSSGYNLSNATIQNIDFTKTEINWKSLDLSNAAFLGCKLTSEQQLEIIKRNAIIFPKIDNLPYNPFRSGLYTWQELYQEGKIEKTIDLEIYNHFSKHKYDPSMMEALSQRIHDNSIDDALRAYLAPNSSGEYKVKSIGIMGGHGTLRTDEYFSKVALTAQKLSSHGYLVMSGGGPGTMEAANLGAYMGNYSAEELKDSIQILAEKPHFTDEGFHDQAVKVLKKYPNGVESLAIPTWFYGHEPSNVFASHIAKYFSNSIREDTLLAISIHGILFAPGSAGTTQEIFMDAAQNHYTTYGYVSPMIFMGKKRYTEETNLYKTIKTLAEGKKYNEMIDLVDSPEDALKAFLNNPPIKVD